MLNGDDGSSKGDIAMIIAIFLIMTMMVIIVPHVVVVGRAPVPMFLVTVGSQLLIHDKVTPVKA